VTVPLRYAGKVCPEAKVICPLLAIESPVSAGEVPFDPNRRFNVPEGDDVFRFRPAPPASGVLMTPLRSCC